MRIRRNIIAPLVLGIGTIGALAVGPVLSVTSAAAPAGVVAAAHADPGIMVFGT
jgi:hypothetical protein